MPGPTGEYHSPLLPRIPEQVQGGMAITRKPLCDFVVYTSFMKREDIHIERVYFDPAFWEALEKKLIDCYLCPVVPELLPGCVNGDSVTGHFPSFSAVTPSEVGSFSGERNAKFFQQYVWQF